VFAGDRLPPVNLNGEQKILPAASASFSSTADSVSPADSKRHSGPPLHGPDCESGCTAVAGSLDRRTVGSMSGFSQAGRCAVTGQYAEPCESAWERNRGAHSAAQASLGKHSGQLAD